MADSNFLAMMRRRLNDRIQELCVQVCAAKIKASLRLRSANTSLGMLKGWNVLIEPRAALDRCLIYQGFGEFAEIQRDRRNAVFFKLGARVLPSSSRVSGRQSR